MPDPEADVAAEETVVEQPEAATTEQPEEVVTEGGDKAVTEPTESEAGAESEKGDDDDVQKRIDQAVGKALAAQSAKLGEARKAADAAVRMEAENRLYREELERLRNPRKEEAKDPEITLPNGMDLLPAEAQADYLAEKRARLQQAKEIQALKEARATDQRHALAERIDSVVEDMKKDSENFPGFADVYPQIEEMGRTDPEFLRSVLSNPKRYIRMAYRDLTAESAPVLAERELEKKIQKQVKARTTQPSARDTGGSVKRTGIEAVFEKAWADAGGGGEE